MSTAQMENVGAALKLAASRPGLAPRLKFMLLDLGELRAHGWKARRAAVVDPRKIDHNAAAAAAKKSEADLRAKQEKKQAERQQRERSDRSDERRRHRETSKAASSSSSSGAAAAAGDDEWVTKGGRRAASASASAATTPNPEVAAARGFIDVRAARPAASAASAATPTSPSEVESPFPAPKASSGVKLNSRFGALATSDEDEDEEEEFSDAAEESSVAEHSGVSCDEEDEEEEEDEKTYRTADNEDSEEEEDDDHCVGLRRDYSQESEFGVIGGNSDSDGDSFGTPLSAAQTRRGTSTESGRSVSASLEVSDEGSDLGDEDEEAVEKCAQSATRELLCSHDVKEAVQYFAHLKSETLAAVVVRVIALTAMESNDKGRVLCAQLLRACVATYETVFSSAAIANGVAQVAGELDDLMIDIPRANDYLVDLVFKAAVANSSADSNANNATSNASKKTLVALDDVLAAAKSAGASVPHVFAEKARAVVA